KKALPEPAVREAARPEPTLEKARPEIEEERKPAPPSRPAPEKVAKAPVEAPPAVEEIPAPPPSEEIVAPPPAAPPPVVSKKDVAGLRKGLAATRGGFMARLKAIFVGKKEIDPAILEQLEEVMLTSDVGVKTTQAILERLRDRMQKHELA